MKHYALFSVVLLLSSFSTENATAWTMTRDYSLTAGTVPGSPVPGLPGDACRNAPGALLALDPIDSSNQVCKLTITQGSDGWMQGWGGTLTYPTPLGKGDEIWVRIRVFFPQNFDFTATAGGRLKFLRVNTTGGSKNDLYFVPSTAPAPNDTLGYIYEGEDKWEFFGPFPTREQWETYEMYIKFDTASIQDSGQARVRVWKDGHLLVDIQDRYTLKNPTDVADQSLVFTYWNGGAPRGQYAYIDDLYITNETPTTLDDTGFPFIGTAVHLSRPSAPTDLQVH
jgi:hypothetical protein